MEVRPVLYTRRLCLSVCVSSQVTSLPPHPRARCAAQAKDAAGFLRLAPRPRRRSSQPCDKQIFAKRPLPSAPVTPALPAITDTRGGEEIGRAQCRDRVCKYVEIPVVGVTINKNIEQTKRNEHT